MNIELKKYTKIEFLFLFFMVGVPLVASTSIAFATPGDILDNYWARKWVEWILRLFPKLLDVPEQSRDPHVVVFYHATMLFLDVVISIPVTLISLDKLTKKRREGAGGRSVWMNLKLSACGALMVAMAVGIFSMGYSDGRGAVFWYSRASLAFGAIIYHMSSLLFLSATVTVFVELLILLGVVRLIGNVF